MSTPTCAWCSKPIRKHATTVYIEREPAPYHRNSTWARYHYCGDGPRPHNMAECKLLTNQTVLSIMRTIDGHVASFNEWDGKTYAPLCGFFCTNTCAQELGRAAATAGFRGKRS